MPKDAAAGVFKGDESDESVLAAMQLESDSEPDSKTLDKAQDEQVLDPSPGPQAYEDFGGDDGLSVQSDVEESDQFKKCASERYALSQLVKPDFLILSTTSSLNWYGFKIETEEKYHDFYPYGTMLRSGLEVKSVNKSVNGFDVPTLGVFATCDIPMHAFVSYYGGELQHQSNYHSLSEKSHAVRIPNSMLVMDGKPYAELFTRPMQLLAPSYPCLDPSHPYMSSYLSSGIGFMMNHASRRFANCILRYVYPSYALESRGIISIPILIAKRHISPGEELTWFYNNFEAYCNNY